MKPEDGAPVSAVPRRALLLAPLGVAAVCGAGSWLLLERLPQEADGPPQVPSVLIGKLVPPFSLPGQPPGDGFSSADVIAAGRPVLINFFASWCMPCAQEAPVLQGMKQQGTAVWGIAYKDKVEATSEFLRNGDDPYTRVARDESGATGNEFGLYGVPESFLIDTSGIVRWHWAGGLSEDVVRQSLAPLLRSLA
ncbi:MAG TPA: redoxin domain-containing protein [Acetobacteraceae bacterium]|jgi:cytochrome c biogenesis protein CcmG/thiol:disulfide interchange protein DsbE|nr:redoxin domain-containing protein [Acetobacteraceae bacterium]